MNLCLVIQEKSPILSLETFIAQKGLQEAQETTIVKEILHCLTKAQHAIIHKIVCFGSDHTMFHPIVQLLLFYSHMLSAYL